MRKKVISCVTCILIIATIFVIEIPKDVNAQVTEEWVARYSSSGNQADIAEAIAIDETSRNIYVTGYKASKFPDITDIATIAYDSDGNELWAAIYDAPGISHEWGTDIAIGPSGNVYVTGWGTPGYIIIAYNPSGNELWVVNYESGKWLSAIALDQSENIYVTGEDWGGGYTTVAYDSSGKQLWVAEYTGPANLWSVATDICVDCLGIVYVTGYSGGISSDLDYATIAYNSSGKELWVARYNGPGNGRDEANAIAIGQSGNIYVTGHSNGNGTSIDYATVAYDSAGKELWVARYNSPQNQADFGYAFDIDLSENIYVTGASQISGMNYDYTTVAYDNKGNELWMKKYNGPGNSEDYASAIIVDKSGYVYVSGWSKGIGTNFDYATVAYTMLGTELWIARFNSVGNYYDRPFAIAVDSSNNIYVTGSSPTTTTGYDYVTIKYSYIHQPIQSTIDIDPNTLNLKSKGRWITCYITLNKPYDVNDIDISTILLEDTIPAEWGDIQGDTLMVKFDRSEVEDILSPGTYNLKVTGELTDGTEFEGYSDEIRVIDPGK